MARSSRKASPATSGTLCSLAALGSGQRLLSIDNPRLAEISAAIRWSFGVARYVAAAWSASALPAFAAFSARRTST